MFKKLFKNRIVFCLLVLLLFGTTVLAVDKLEQAHDAAGGGKKDSAGGSLRTVLAEPAAGEKENAAGDYKLRMGFLGIPIGLQQGTAKIKGKILDAVTLDLISSPVFDVVLYRSNSSGIYEEVIRTPSNGGAYQMFNLVPNTRFKLIASGIGYRPGETSEFNIQANDDLTKHISVESGNLAPEDTIKLYINQHVLPPDVEPTGFYIYWLVGQGAGLVPVGKTIDVYMSYGGTEGEFINDYDEENWQIIIDNNQFVVNLGDYGFKDQIDNAAFIHLNQFGTGKQAVYFKAVLGDVDTSVPVGVTVFNSALAVGKLNVIIDSSYKLMTVPFYYPENGITAGTSISRIFGKQISHGTIQVYREDSGLRPYLSDQYGIWQNENVLIKLSDGFWIKAQSPITCTLYGDVFAGFYGTYTDELALGYNIYGYPIPTYAVIDQNRSLIPGIVPFDGDVIQVLRDGLRPYIYQGNSWSDDFTLSPEEGYWYKNPSGIGRVFRAPYYY